MSLMNSTGDRLRRATALWHAYLTVTGQRFELALFLKDPALEKQVIAGALTHGDPEASRPGAGLAARHWPGGAGRVATRVTPAAPAVANLAPAEAAKPSRYLRGVR